MSRVPRPPGFQILPYDGLLRLGPGEILSLAIEALPNPSHDDAAALVLHARGKFLAACFAVDNELILLQLADQFSTTDPSFGGTDFLSAEAQLRKKTLGQNVSAAVPILGKENAPKDLISDLRELVVVRNLFAHQPSWLTPINVEGLTTGFMGCLANENYIWMVDGQQVEDWMALIERGRKVADVTKGLLEGRPPLPERKTIGAWPMGILIPPGDPLAHHSDMKVIAQVAGLPFNISERE